MRNAGLDTEHPVLKKARDYLVNLLEGKVSTGQSEKQDDLRWYPLMLELLIAAAMLFLLDSKHVDYILSQRNEEGLWEFPGKFDFMLSDRWQGRHKAIDSTLYVLRLLIGKQSF